MKRRLDGIGARGVVAVDGVGARDGRIGAGVLVNEPEQLRADDVRLGHGAGELVSPLGHRGLALVEARHHGTQGRAERAGIGGRATTAGNGLARGERLGEASAAPVYQGVLHAVLVPLMSRRAPGARSVPKGPGTFGAPGRRS